MTLTRRSFLSGSACLPVLAAAASPGVASVALGSASLVTVSDGSLVLPGSLVFSPLPAEKVSSVLSDFAISPDQLTPECNLALYRDGQNTVLFDVGAGPDFMPTAGTLHRSLAAIDLAPDDVTHVLFTHAHPDHIWGLLDDFDEIAFPNAHFMMGRAEWDYWWDPATRDTIGDARAAFAVGAKRRMRMIEDSVSLFEDGEEVLPGIAAVASPGHTPGHMSFELRNGTQGAMVIGDAIGNHHVAVRRPDWHSGTDQDMARAATTRAMLLDRLAHEKMPLVGFHLPGGGIGTVAAGPDGYRFVQEES